jgi:hypothetical protein
LKRQRKEIVAKEQDGVASALERCCELAKEICARLREKEPGTLDIGALAQFRVALECASLVLDRAEANTEKKPVTASSPNPLPPPERLRVLKFGQSGERPER